MELIELFNSCDHCKLPIHLINYPQLINLNTNELKNLLLIKNNIPNNLLSHDNKCNYCKRGSSS